MIAIEGRLSRFPFSKLLNKSYCVSATEGGVWTGATDRAEEGTFVWEDGSKPEDYFVDWATGEPNDGRGIDDCLFINKMRRWNDVKCQGEYASVCELD